MNQAITPAWVRALFRYQAQLRSASGREITAEDISVLKAVAALVICDMKPSPDMLALESGITKDAIWRCLRKMASMGVLLPYGAWWTTAAPATWQGYRPHAADPVGIDRLVASFVTDMEGRILALQRRHPQKRRA